MIEKAMNISFLEKSENDLCNSFLHYFASPENLTCATLQPVHDLQLHMFLAQRAKLGCFRYIFQYS